MTLLCSFSWAGYFIENEELKKEPVRELPTLFWGGSFDVGFYLNSLDVGIEGSAEYRLHKNHSLGLSANGLFGGGLYGVGADWKIFFNGSLMEDGYNDFIRVNASGLYFEKFDESYFRPMISVGYGRDFIPLRNANFLCRLELRLAYLLGESITDDDDSFINQETHLVTYIGIGIFLF